MNIDEVRSFTKIINSYNDIEYLFSTIICSAAPTLAREKVSSLLNFSNNNRSLKNTWKDYKGYIKDILHIDFYELKNDKENTVVLFYNREKLKKVMKEKRNLEFLKKFGYSEEMTMDQRFSHLSAGFQGSCPHEIGIFLGYPVDDVACFIECPNEKCKIAGYWKVYNNVEEAIDIFNKYDNIKYNVIRMMIDGIKPMEIIKRVYTILENYSLDFNGERKAISFAYGLYEFSSDPNDIDELLKVADKRMYEKKRGMK